MPVWRATRRAWIVGWLAALTLGPGCGPGGSGPGASTTQQKAIDEVMQLFRSYKKGQRPAPKGLNDLARLEHGYPAAISALRNQEILVFWGSGLSDAPEAASTILAYEKATPDAGGLVLLQDGTVKTLTADAFKAAPKAPGSTSLGPIKKR